MRLPQYVDPRKLAHKGGVFEGQLLPEDMPRVVEAVHKAAPARVAVRFDVEEQGRRVLLGELSLEAQLVCQRCLQPVDYTVRAEPYLAVVPDEERAKQLPGHIEPWIVPDETANLHAILEEELLLAMPVVAFHDHECIDPRLMSAGEETEEPAKENNPFQVLAALKSKPGSDDE